MSHGYNLKRWSAIITIVLLALLLFYSLQAFQGGILGALILFTLFRPVQAKFVDKYKMNNSLSAVLVMIMSIIFLLLPITGMVLVVNNGVTNYLHKLNENGGISKVVPSSWPSWIDPQKELINGVKIEDITKDFQIAPMMEKVASWVQNLVVSAASSISSFGLQILIMYFILFYLLVDMKHLHQIYLDYNPFNKTNATRLLKEFHNMTFVSIVGAGIGAFIQGLILTCGFWIFKLDEPIFWGLIGAALAFIPVVGTVMIWLPAGIICLINGNNVAGIGILLWGGVLMSITDNVLRLVLNRKLGDIHPLISLLGVFIGIPLFGILGLVIGPVLLSFFILLVRMYREEFVVTKPAVKVPLQEE